VNLQKWQPQEMARKALGGAKKTSCNILTFSDRRTPFGTAMSIVVVAKVHQIVQSDN
jgi:hypothetical protein